MLFWWLILLFALGLYFYNSKKTPTTHHSSLPSDETTHLTRAYNELQQCQLANPQLQEEKEGIVKSLFALIYKIKQQQGYQLATNQSQSQLSPSTLSPQPNFVTTVQTQTTRAITKIDNTNILLLIGAFLIVVAAGLFIGYSYENLSNSFKFFALTFTTLAFYLSGFYLYKTKAHLKFAGMTFLAIGLILFPLLGISYHQLFPGSDHYNVVLAFSLITAVIYFVTYQFISQKALIYLSLFAFLIFEQSFILRFNLPNIFHGITNLLTATLILFASKNTKIKTEKLDRDFYFIAHLLAPLSLLFFFQNPYGDNNFLFNFGFNSCLLALFYYNNLILSANKALFYQLTSLALFSSLSAFSAFYEVEFSSYILFALILNFALINLGHLAKYCSFEKNVFAFFIQILYFIIIAFDNTFNQEIMSLNNLIALSLSHLFVFIPTYLKRQPLHRYLYLFILSFALTMYFHLIHLFPQNNLLPYYGVLITTFLPLLYVYLQRRFPPNLKVVFWLLVIMNLFHSYSFFKLQDYSLFLCCYLGLFSLYYLLEKNLFSLYCNLLFPIFIIFNLQFSQNLSFYQLITFYTIISSAFLITYFYEKSWFKQTFVPALTYQGASLFLVFYEAQRSLSVFSYKDEFLAYALIILLSALSFILPYYHHKKATYLQITGVLLIFSFYSFMIYKNPYDFPFINLLLLPWSLFFLCSHLYQKYWQNKTTSFNLDFASFLLVLPTTILASSSFHQYSQEFYQLVLLIEGVLLTLFAQNNQYKNIKIIGLIAIFLDAIFFISPFILDIPSWVILGLTGLLFLGVATFITVHKNRQKSD